MCALSLCIAAAALAHKAGDCSPQGTKATFFDRCICMPGWMGARCASMDTTEACLPANDPAYGKWKWKGGTPRTNLKRQCWSKSMASPFCSWTASYGSVQVNEDVWHMARRDELKEWQGKPGHFRPTGLRTGDDRSDEHIEGFRGYAAVPAGSLGRTIEIGCGPWTQLRALLKRRQDVHVGAHLTLVDPNVADYANFSSVYHGGVFHAAGRSVPAELIAAGGEAISGAKHAGMYDTLVMINVVEHVQDAVMLLQNVYRALKPGGLLIFHEKHMDHERREQVKLEQC